MMPLGVIGISHKTASLKHREQFANVCERRFRPGPFTQGDYPSVLLSTCNRVEWYFSSADLARTHSYFLQILREENLEHLEPKLFCYFGTDCLSHLARVTSGLDSAIVGETEIQGQVKVSYEAAVQCYGQLPKEMHFAFQKSLKVGKDVRSSLLPQDGAFGLEHTIHRLNEQLYPDVEDVSVLFVGASEINCKVLAHLKAKGMESITLCNRTMESAERVAEHYGVDILPWHALHRWHEYDCLIVGTRSPDYVIKGNTLPEAHTGRCLMIDLSVPRNVDPALNRRPQLTVLNLDQINNIVNSKKAKLDHAVMQAEIFVRDSIHNLVERYQKKAELRLSCVAAG